jgi:hypothetical protein
LIAAQVRDLSLETAEVDPGTGSQRRSQRKR